MEKYEIDLKRLLKYSTAAFAFGIGVFCLTSPSSLAQSRSYCEEYARNYASRNSQGQALRSTGRGAAGGAIIGAIAGDAGAGAAAGALFGGIRGSVYQSNDYSYLCSIAYDDCIRGRVRY